MCGRFSNAQPVYQYTASVEEQLRRRRRNQNNSEDYHEANSQPTKTIPTNSSSSSTECDNSLPLHTAVSEEDYYPTHNVSPTSRVPVLRLETPVPLPLSGQREKKGEEEENNNNSKNGNENGLLIECMRWGLLPAHTTAIPRGPDVLRTINARDDSVLSFQSMWTPLLQKGKRCVVFCQGFFEWQKKGDGTKIAHFVGMLDNGTARTDVNGKQKALMPMAGLYERCIIDEQEIYSFTIITTESNKQLNFLHDRMPVILPDSESIMTWLGFRPASSRQVCSLLKPYDGGSLDVYPVPREVGKVGNDDKNFILPVSKRKDGIAAAFGKVKKAVEKDVNTESHAPMMEEVKATEGSVKRKREEDDSFAQKRQSREGEEIEKEKQSQAATVKAEEVNEEEERRLKQDEELARRLQSEEDERDTREGGKDTAGQERHDGQQASSKFSPEPYNPPTSPHRPQGGYSNSSSSSTQASNRTSPRRPAPSSKKLEQAAKGTKDIRNFFGSQSS